MNFTLRDATPDDAGLIAGFVHALAVYEKLEHEAKGTEADFRAALEAGHIGALIVAVDEAPVGFALWYFTFSTFVGRRGLYLEDIFVMPANRGAGIGRAIFRDLARRAVALGCQRMEWSVLDWNTPAVKFYRALGARAMDDWTVQRLDGDALAKLAA